MKRLFFVSFLPGLPLLMAGCASVSVSPDPAAPGSPQANAEVPHKIILTDFSFADADVRADREGQDLEDFEKKVDGDMTRALLISVGKLDLPVEAGGGPADSPSPQPAWLVRGRFLRVYQGSRALRSFIGFGAGGTKLETAVEVYDLSVSRHVPAFTFRTTGGSGAEPGGLLSPNPVGVAIGTAVKTGKGLSDDTKRTARMIAAYLSQVLYQRGYLPAGKVHKAKMLASDDPAPAH